MVSLNLILILSALAIWNHFLSECQSLLESWRVKTSCHNEWTKVYHLSSTQRGTTKTKLFLPCGHTDWELEIVGPSVSEMETMEHVEDHAPPPIPPLIPRNENEDECSMCLLCKPCVTSTRFQQAWWQDEAHPPHKTNHKRRKPIYKLFGWCWPLAHVLTGILPDSLGWTRHSPQGSYNARLFWNYSPSGLIIYMCLVTLVLLVSL